MNKEMPPSVQAVGVPVAPTFQDRSTLLFMFGVAEILLGVLCGLMFLLGVLMQVNYGIYLLAGVFLVWMGIGSILVRRWARALMLTISSVGLAVGSLNFLGFCVVIPLIFLRTTLRTAVQDGNVPPGFAIGMVVVMLVFLFTIFILLPGVFVLFYRSPHVKATCEYKDPVLRWTDKCPLPVLAVSFMCCVVGAWMLLMAPGTPVFPFLDTLITGPLATALMAGVGVVFLLLSWGIYCLKPAAWWGCISLIILGGIFSLVTYPRVDWLEFYRAAGHSQQVVDTIDRMGTLEIMESPGMVGLMVYTFVPYLGYLLYVRRYFKDAR